MENICSAKLVLGQVIYLNWFWDHYTVHPSNLYVIIFLFRKIIEIWSSTFTKCELRRWYSMKSLSKELTFQLVLQKRSNKLAFHVILRCRRNGVLYLQNIVLEIIYNRFPIGYHASRKIKRMVERKWHKALQRFSKNVVLPKN